jgi:quinol-cytochrome oxidoreductase complex cytochrome b subunit
MIVSAIQHAVVAVVVVATAYTLVLPWAGKYTSYEIPSGSFRDLLAVMSVWIQAFIGWFITIAIIVWSVTGVL